MKLVAPRLEKRRSAPVLIKNLFQPAPRDKKPRALSRASPGVAKSNYRQLRADPARGFDISRERVPGTRRIKYTPAARLIRARARPPCAAGRAREKY